jgi:hypothetical protein
VKRGRARPHSDGQRPLGTGRHPKRKFMMGNGIIPAGDPQIKYLHSRPELFPDHTQEAFEGVLERDFVVEERVVLEPMGRVLYLGRKR